MKRLISVLSVLAAGGFASNAMAVGTVASTPVDNTATADFVIDGTPGTQDSNEVSFLVDEVLNVDVTAGAPSTVDTPDTDQPLAFTVTNLGNGDEAIVLDIERVVAGDEFDPTDPTGGVQLYYDTDNSGDFDPAFDQPYDPANPDVFAPDETRTVFVISDIPGALTSGDTGDVTLTARPQTQVDNDDPGVDGDAAAPGTQYNNDGDGGTTAVVGDTGALDADTNNYLVSNLDVTFVKRATKVFDATTSTTVSEVIDDGTGAASAATGVVQLPGDIIEYQLEFTASGNGVVDDLVISDPFPGVTTYVVDSGTVTIVSEAGTTSYTTLTDDAADSDGLSVTATDLTVVVENLAGVGDPGVSLVTGDADTVITVTFQVTIQ